METAKTRMQKGRRVCAIIFYYIKEMSIPDDEHFKSANFLGYYLKLMFY